MSCVHCSATICGFNKSSYCSKKNLSVEGMFSKSKVGTFCQSFQNPNNSDLLKSEMAKDMLDDLGSEKEKIQIKCSANYCTFNSQDYCIAKEIKIGNQSAKYRSETQCDSFKAK